MRLSFLPRFLGVALAVVTAITSIAACGGGAGAARPPESERAPPSKSHDDEPGSPRSAPRAAVASRAAPAPRCDDGTCFPCGNGSCPSGFYCDESTKGGAACSWLPACLKGSCDCLTRALGGCSCKMESGGAIVRCE